MRVTVKDRAEYAGVIAFAWLVRRLPSRFALAAADALGAMAFDVLGYRRRVALANLESRLGSDGEAQAGGSGAGPRGDSRIRYTRVGRKAVQTFVEGLVEFVRLPDVGKPYDAEHFTFEGGENLDRAISRGRGAVLVTGHFGSWELACPVLARRGYHVDVVVGVQRNLLVQRMMNEIRRRSGVGVIEPEGLFRAVKSLKENRLVAMLSDQDAGKKGVFVDFLGAPASTPKGPARLAILSGAPIVPGFIIRSGGPSHRIVLETPLWPARIPSEAAVLDLTQAYTRVIESYVRRYPDHWLWTHRRWKTRPA
jgi:KDO2-lipid IV(A) lauroyltransferase